MNLQSETASSVTKAPASFNERQKSPPSVVKVLEWVRDLGGVVMPEWAQNPTRCKLARVVFPEIRGSRKVSTTSLVVKNTINAFFPHVDIKDTKKHSCRILVDHDGRYFQVLVLESNLPVLPSVGEIPLSEFRAMDFFPYGTCERRSKATTFLGVEGVRVLIE